MKGITLNSKRRLIRSLLCLAFSSCMVQLASANEAPQGGDSNDFSSSPSSANSLLVAEPNDLLLTSRIIGGRDAEANSWPSLVALVSPGMATVKNRFFCGGTVVAERWVMTAAHCLFGSFGQEIRPSSLRVITGIDNLETDVPEEEIIVTNIILHPLFNNQQTYSPFDIALLELGSAVNVPAVNLFAGDTAEYSGVSSYIAGWGATRYVDENDVDYPSQLQDATVPIVPLARCNSVVSFQGLITHRQVCAGFLDGGIDACVGDSGGPLFIIEDGVSRQMGITSYGNGCALPNFYGIYTSVSHLLPWLSDYIDVPYQSAELVALLDAGATESDDKRYFFGAIHPLSVLLLCLYLLSRRRPNR